MGVDNARKESNSRAVTLPAEVHLGCGCRCSGMAKESGEIDEGKWKERIEVVCCSCRVVLRMERRIDCVTRLGTVGGRELDATSQGQTKRH